MHAITNTDSVLRTLAIHAKFRRILAEHEENLREMRQQATPYVGDEGLYSTAFMHAWAAVAPEVVEEEDSEY